MVSVRGVIVEYHDLEHHKRIRRPTLRIASQECDGNSGEASNYAVTTLWLGPFELWKDEKSSSIGVVILHHC